MRVVVRLALGMLPLASFAISLFSLETVEPERWFQTAWRSYTRARFSAEKAKWSPNQQHGVEGLGVVPAALCSRWFRRRYWPVLMRLLSRWRVASKPIVPRES